MMEPKVNTITHITCLITGDRFYCWSDPKKEVWELRFHTLIKLSGKYKKLSQCKNDKGEVTRFDSNRVIMFLRRTKPKRPKVFGFDLNKYFA
jgi:hypothetical protein